MRTGKSMVMYCSLEVKPNMDHFTLGFIIKLHDHQSPLCNYLEGFTFYFCFTSLPSTCQSQARCSTKNAGAWSR